MSYLDVNPVITALGTNPDHFAFSSGSLQHIPSGHRFAFDPKGQVRIDAQCACAHLEVRKDQEQELFQAFSDWRRNYWYPSEINRQFAAHFTLSLWRRVLLALTRRLHHALLRQSQKAHSLEIASIAAE
jgi:hypothetical protein